MRGSPRELLATGGRRRRLVWIAGSCLALVAAFEFGQMRAGHNMLEAGLSQRRLQAQLAELRAENRTARQALARMETDGQVDREVYAQVEAQLPGLQDKILEQQEELAFYRGIVGGPGQGGLRVQEFVQEAGDAGGIRIRFVLARVENAQQPVRGQIQMRIEGTRAGRPGSLDLASLAATPGSVARDFSFRYFQELSAEVRLPGDFLPERLMIRILPLTPGVQASVESFPWGASVRN